MNTLFNTTFETEEASHHEECVRLRPQTYDLQESNVQLKLTIVDAVGFGDQINKDERQEAGRAASPSLIHPLPMWALDSLPEHSSPLAVPMRMTKHHTPWGWEGPVGEYLRS